MVYSIINSMMNRASALFHIQHKATPADLDKLPVEIWLQVFNHLPAKDIVSFNRTCKLAHHITDLTGIDINARLEDEALEILWEKKLSPCNFLFQKGETKPRSLLEIKKWLANPANEEKLAAFKELDFSHCNLKVIPAQLLSKFKNLRTLFLTNNKLTSLPDSLCTLSNLHCLYLNNNLISYLPESFGNLSNLRFLWIQNNCLTKLPESFFNLKLICELELENNKFSYIPESLGTLICLERLHLNNNKLSKLPESIGNLTKLQTFYAHTNKLTNLPESIGNLQSLVSLQLHNNKLECIPDSIGNLTHLIELLTSNNKLTRLPESIGNLSSLRNLLLDNNQLKTLPDSISRLNLLVELRLKNNHLVNLPDLSTFNELKAFTYTGNPSLHIPDDLAARFPLPYTLQEVMYLFNSNQPIDPQRIDLSLINALQNLEAKTAN